MIYFCRFSCVSFLRFALVHFAIGSAFILIWSRSFCERFYIFAIWSSSFCSRFCIFVVCSSLSCIRFSIFFQFDNHLSQDSASLWFALFHFATDSIFLRFSLVYFVADFPLAYFVMCWIYLYYVEKNVFLFCCKIISVYGNKSLIIHD